MSDTPLGFCQCGCRGKTNIRNNHFNLFLRGHNSRRDGKTRNHNQVRIWCPNHPRSSSDGYVPEHILIAEKALGKYLTRKHEVHHHNRDSFDNSNLNLVICEDRKYHRLLHVRTRASEACCNVNWRICDMCHEYDDPNNMMNYKNSTYRHWPCHVRKQKERRDKIRLSRTGGEK